MASQVRPVSWVFFFMMALFAYDICFVRRLFCEIQIMSKKFPHSFTHQRDGKHLVTFSLAACHSQPGPTSTVTQKCRGKLKMKRLDVRLLITELMDLLRFNCIVIQQTAEMLFIQICVCIERSGKVSADKFIKCWTFFTCSRKTATNRLSIAD